MTLATSTCPTCKKTRPLLPGMTGMICLHGVIPRGTFKADGDKLRVEYETEVRPPEDFGPLTAEWETGVRDALAERISRDGAWGLNWKDYALLALLAEVDRLRGADTPVVGRPSA